MVNVKLGNELINMARAWDKQNFFESSYHHLWMDISSFHILLPRLIKKVKNHTSHFVFTYHMLYFITGYP